MKSSVSSERRLGMEGKLWEQLENHSACEKRLGEQMMYITFML